VLLKRCRDTRTMGVSNVSFPRKKHPLVKFMRVAAEGLLVVPVNVPHSFVLCWHFVFVSWRCL